MKANMDAIRKLVEEYNAARAKYLALRVAYDDALRVRDDASASFRTAEQALAKALEGQVFIADGFSYAESCGGITKMKIIEDKWWKIIEDK